MARKATERATETGAPIRRRGGRTPKANLDTTQQAQSVGQGGGGTIAAQAGNQPGIAPNAGWPGNQPTGGIGGDDGFQQFMEGYHKLHATGCRIAAQLKTRLPEVRDQPVPELAFKLVAGGMRTLESDFTELSSASATQNQMQAA